ncbi:imidazolonepropionase-like domain-containing protein [Streptomyces sp. NPDC050256]|uniref:imidazolonepropionase-like domain-containing protein n=1 Tax=unclassified Streptomyces TaxID=2593676 RepID=UPI00379208C1
MLTIHAAALLLPGGGRAPVPGGAVAVQDAVVAEFGPYGELAAAHPTARVRRWPGVLTPGLLQRDAVRLLEESYFPDPREADTVGTAPLTGEALDALGPDDTWRAGSVRRGLHRMLRHGTTAATAAPTAPPALITAMRRSGLLVTGAPERPGTAPRLDPLAGAAAVADATAGPLAVGGRADLAAFDVPDEAALLAAGAVSCVATVAAGRLVYRGR